MATTVPCRRCLRTLLLSESQISGNRTSSLLNERSWCSVPSRRHPALAGRSFSTNNSRPYRASSSRSKGLASPPKPTSGIAGSLTSAAPKTTETYVAFGVTSNLFRQCNSQAAYFFPQRESKPNAEVPTLASGEELGITDTDESWWHDELGMQPTFSTWSQVCMLHMYIIIVRLRALPSRESFQIYHQHLLDHFTYEAEDKMTVLHNMTSSSIRNKYLKDIYLQWRGILASYDEGLLKGDAVLGAAIWRNLWKADENVDWRNVAKVVAYMRRLIRVLGDDEDGSVLAQLSGVAPSEAGDLFRKIQKEESLVAQRSKGIDEAFGSDDTSNAATRNDQGSQSASA